MRQMTHPEGGGQKARWHNIRQARDGRYVCTAWGCTFATLQESAANWHRGTFAGIEVTRPRGNTAVLAPILRDVTPRQGRATGTDDV